MEDGKVKKLIYLALILSFFFYCGTKQDKVERIIEDGVGVILNHIKPYKIKGEPSILHLKEEFMIDTEKDELVEMGLTTINNFDVDSENNLYVLSSRTEKDFIFKFDRNGKLISTLRIYI